MLAVNRPASDTTAATPMPRCLFRHAPHVLSTQHVGTTVLFDLRTYYTLPNEVSSRIWELLGDEASAAALIAALEAEYDAPHARIATDVAAVLAQLLRDKLIERVPPPGSRAMRRRWWQLWGAEQ